MAEIERKTPIAVGTPAIEGMTALETVMATPGYVSPRDEFGPARPNWIATELDESARQGEAEAKLRAVAKMRKDLR